MNNVCFCENMRECVLELAVFITNARQRITFVFIESIPVDPIPSQLHKTEEIL